MTARPRTHAASLLLQMGGYYNRCAPAFDIKTLSGIGDFHFFGVNIV